MERLMKKRDWIVLLMLLIFCAVFNYVSTTNLMFCDYYIQNIFPILSGFYACATSLLPFSLGELMIIFYAICCILAFFSLVYLLIHFLMKFHTAICSWMKNLCNHFLRFFAYLSGFAILLLTLNCFSLYHSSGFEELYMNGINGIPSDQSYTYDELVNVRDYIVTQSNLLSAQMTRDENGHITYEGNMAEAARESMQKLGTQYSRLDGYYSLPKALASSNFISQQFMRGYYFPFSMEANYNDVMNIMNKPSTMCHELAHTKGFMKEDEANLIGFLACIESDDPLFQYSGYLSVLNYIDQDFYTSTGNNKYIYSQHVKISSQVKKDNEFLSKATEETIEKTAVVKTAVVKKATAKFINTNLVMNGIPEGSLSYNHVVGLLLGYYQDGTMTPDNDFMLALN